MQFGAVDERREPRVLHPTVTRPRQSLNTLGSALHGFGRDFFMNLQASVSDEVEVAGQRRKGKQGQPIRTRPGIEWVVALRPMRQRRVHVSDDRLTSQALGQAARCPVCQNLMRVIAVIDDPQLVPKILRDLGLWQDPPMGLPPPGLPRPCKYEPCQDVDPMPE